MISTIALTIHLYQPLKRKVFRSLIIILHSFQTLIPQINFVLMLSIIVIGVRIIYFYRLLIFKSNIYLIAVSNICLGFIFEEMLLCEKNDIAYPTTPFILDLHYGKSMFFLLMVGVFGNCYALV